MEHHVPQSADIKSELIPLKMSSRFKDRLPLQKLVTSEALQYIGSNFTNSINFVQGQEVLVAGWIRKKRVHAEQLFIEISDGSAVSSFQIIVLSKDLRELTEPKEVAVGASLLARGIIVKSPAKGQLVEMQASDIQLLGLSDAKLYPLSKTKLELEFLRTVAHLRTRTRTLGAVAKVRSTASFAIHKYFQDRGFFYVHTPLITASDCEGAGELFTVTTLLSSMTPTPIIDYSKDFFGKEAHLTVSGQLEGEAYACGLSQIYTFGPTFRAEKGNTPRHLAEFWMIEPEIAFAELPDLIDIAEDFLKYVMQYCLTHCLDELEWLDQYHRMDKKETGLLSRVRSYVADAFERVTYTRAVELLIQSGKEFCFPVSWGIDLATEHERYLTEQIFKKPVILTDYPKDIKSFYMKVQPDGKTVAAMDILVPKIGEIVGGSQREDKLDLLEKRMEELHMKKEAYSWYLDLRRYGSVPHSGFGLGLERLIMLLTGMDNIRDVIPFPRYPGHADF